MGNHCIEVVCADCGACYCLRCNDGSGPSLPIAALAMAAIWEDDQRGKMDQECRFCRSDKVYGSSIISFSNNIG